MGKLKKHLPVLILSVIVVLLLGYVIGSHNKGSTNNTPVTGEIENTEGAENAEIEVVPVKNTNSITIPGFEALTIKARKTTQSVELYNPERNQCYFEISICLPEGTELFRSGLLAPGKSINTIELSHALEPGIYPDAIIKYSCFALDTLELLNGADVTFILEVVQ